MTKFNAKFETLTSHLGVVELYDAKGEWAGSFRVDRRETSLYDAAYRVANREATLKGGRLETFTQISG